MRLFYEPPVEVTSEVIPLQPSDPIPKATVTVAKRSPVVIKIESLQEWDQALREIRKYRICGLDIETTGLDPLTSRIRLAQLALPDNRVYVADLFALGREALDDLAFLVEDLRVTKVIHNAKFELSFIQASQRRRLHPDYIFCTMLASQVAFAGYYVPKTSANPNKFTLKKIEIGYSLEDLAIRHLGIELQKEYQVSDWSGELSQEQIQYAGMDAAVLLRLRYILLELLKMNKLEDVAELEFAAIPAVVEMELQGLPLDIQATRDLREEKRIQVEKMAHDLQAEAKANGFVPRQRKGKKQSEDLNPHSTYDITDYLECQGYKPASTKEEDLRDLNCPWADRLLKYRRISRQVKFLEEWLLKLHPVDGRLHAKYMQLQADTGRFACSNPNVQQVPKKGEDGQALRKLFRAPQGKKLIKGDFSGIELRTMARLSRDETMSKAFQQERDLHKLTASKISGIPIEQITKDQRQGAKAVNFLLIYGGQPELLKKRAKETYGVNMTIEEAEEAYRKFFESYPGVEIWHRLQRASKGSAKPHHFHCAASGFYQMPLVCSETVIGRKRVWPWYGERSQATVNQLYNTPNQGTGADLLKSVMAEVYSSLPEEVKLIVSVHDEVVLEAPEDMAEEMAIKLRETMRRIGSEMLDPVPVDAEVDVLDSWGG